MTNDEYQELEDMMVTSMMERHQAGMGGVEVERGRGAARRGFTAFVALYKGERLCGTVYRGHGVTRRAAKRACVAAWLRDMAERLSPATVTR